MGLISDVLSAGFDRGLLSMPGKATNFWLLGPSAAASAPFIDLNGHNLEQRCVFLDPNYSKCPQGVYLRRARLFVLNVGVRSEDNVTGSFTHFLFFCRV